jgi:lipopolysaccharide export system protein LptA
MIRRSVRSLPLLLLCIGLSGPASSQDALSALKGHNSRTPVDVAADRIELQDRADRALLSGNVEIKQGDLTLKAPRVTVAYTRAGSTEIQRMDASGGVTVVSPTETARSQYAIYDFNRRLITMLGGVQLSRSGSNINGGRLVIDMNTGRASVDGSNVGGGTSTGGGRVTGRFTVPDRPGSEVKP